MDVFGKKDGRKLVYITQFAPTFPHLPLEVRNAELYDYRCPNAPLGYKKDATAKTPEISTVSGFFVAVFSSENKKMSQAVFDR